MSANGDWREPELAQLRAEVSALRSSNDALRLSLAIALDRAEAAEDRLRNLTEELREARETPLG